MTARDRILCAAVVALLLCACGDGEGAPDAAGDMDAGLSADAGPEDAGRADAGPGDAGQGDAGTDAGRFDAGADADVPRDGGPAMGEGLPFDHPFPASATGGTAVRLDQETFVLAYADDADPATPEGEELVFQRVRRVGHRLVFDPPQRFAHTTIRRSDAPPLELIGALGDAHFFTVVLGPGFTRSMRAFRIDAGTLVDLGTTTLPGDPQETVGHPVDATRYIIGYRDSNTGQPLRYRLLIRAGDTFRFGPPVTRPGPESFPGLASEDSGSDPPLFRVGPTTFVEARPGYVRPPGYLATWTLSLGAGDTLVTSDPRVHSTRELTMIPEVGADGRGGALVAYHTYRETDWTYGLYDHATGALTEIGPLGTSGQSSIRNHDGESTDRYFGGAYYVRLPGDSSDTAPLFRVDPVARTVQPLGDAPSLWHAYQAPMMLRAGSIALFVGRSRARFIDLAPSCGDGVLDADETCDDGNNLDGDGCAAGCVPEP